MRAAYLLPALSLASVAVAAPAAPASEVALDKRTYGIFCWFGWCDDDSSSSSAAASSSSASCASVASKSSASAAASLSSVSVRSVASAAASLSSVSVASVASVASVRKTSTSSAPASTATYTSGSGYDWQNWNGALGGKGCSSVYTYQSYRYTCEGQVFQDLLSALTYSCSSQRTLCNAAATWTWWNWWGFSYDDCTDQYNSCVSQAQSDCNKGSASLSSVSKASIASVASNAAASSIASVASVSKASIASGAAASSLASVASVSKASISNAGAAASSVASVASVSAVSVASLATAGLAASSIASVASVSKASVSNAGVAASSVASVASVSAISVASLATAGLAASSIASVASVSKASVSNAGAAASSVASVASVSAASIASVNAGAAASSLASVASVSQASVASVSKTSVAAATPTGIVSGTITSGWVLASNSLIVDPLNYLRILTGSNGDSETMTPAFCVNECATRGFSLAGVENTSECFCGNALVNGGSLSLVSSATPLACTGDKTLTCGGYGGIQLYRNSSVLDALLNTIGGVTSSSSAAPTSTSTSAAAAATTSAAVTLDNGFSSTLQCVSDIDGRLLKGASFTSSVMTYKLCTSYCANNGFTVAGVEYGSECYCGDASAIASTTPSTQCNSPCAGDSSKICGGGQALYLFTATTADVTSNKLSNGWTRKNLCLADNLNGSRLLSGASYSSDTAMTQESCSSFCAANNYDIAGVEYQSQCYCSSSSVLDITAATTSTNCNTACTGNAAQNCGGGNALWILTA